MTKMPTVAEFQNTPEIPLIPFNPPELVFDALPKVTPVFKEMPIIKFSPNELNTPKLQEPIIFNLPDFPREIMTDESKPKNYNAEFAKDLKIEKEPNKNQSKDEQMKTPTSRVVNIVKYEQMPVLESRDLEIETNEEMQQNELNNEEPALQGQTDENLNYEEAKAVQKRVEAVDTGPEVETFDALMHEEMNDLGYADIVTDRLAEQSTEELVLPIDKIQELKVQNNQIVVRSVVNGEVEAIPLNESQCEYFHILALKKNKTERESSILEEWVDCQYQLKQSEELEINGEMQIKANRLSPDAYDFTVQNGKQEIYYNESLNSVTELDVNALRSDEKGLSIQEENADIHMRQKRGDEEPDIEVDDISTEQYEEATGNAQMANLYANKSKKFMNQQNILEGHGDQFVNNELKITSNTRKEEETYPSNIVVREETKNAGEAQEISFEDVQMQNESLQSENEYIPEKIIEVPSFQEVKEVTSFRKQETGTRSLHNDESMIEEEEINEEALAEPEKNAFIPITDTNIEASRNLNNKNKSRESDVADLFASKKTIAKTASNLPVANELDNILSSTTYKRAMMISNKAKAITSEENTETVIPDVKSNEIDAIHEPTEQRKYNHEDEKPVGREEQEGNYEVAPQESDYSYDTEKISFPEIEIVHEKKQEEQAQVQTEQRENEFIESDSFEFAETYTQPEEQKERNEIVNLSVELHNSVASDEIFVPSIIKMTATKKEPGEVSNHVETNEVEIEKSERANAISDHSAAHLEISQFKRGIVKGLSEEDKSGDYEQINLLEKYQSSENQMVDQDFPELHVSPIRQRDNVDYTLEEVEKEESNERSFFSQNEITVAPPKKEEEQGGFENLTVNEQLIELEKDPSFDFSENLPFAQEQERKSEDLENVISTVREYEERNEPLQDPIVEEYEPFEVQELKAFEDRIHEGAALFSSSHKPENISFNSVQIDSAFEQVSPKKQSEQNSVKLATNIKSVGYSKAQKLTEEFEQLSTDYTKINKHKDDSMQSDEEEAVLFLNSHSEARKESQQEKESSYESFEAPNIEISESKTKKSDDTSDVLSLVGENSKFEVEFFEESVDNMNVNYDVINNEDARIIANSRVDSNNFDIHNITDIGRIKQNQNSSGIMCPDVIDIADRVYTAAEFNAVDTIDEFSTVKNYIASGGVEDPDIKNGIVARIKEKVPNDKGKANGLDNMSNSSSFFNALNTVKRTKNYVDSTSANSVSDNDDNFNAITTFNSAAAAQDPVEAANFDELGIMESSAIEEAHESDEDNNEIPAINSITAIKANKPASLIRDPASEEEFNVIHRLQVTSNPKSDRISDSDTRFGSLQYDTEYQVRLHGAEEASDGYSDEFEITELENNNSSPSQSIPLKETLPPKPFLSPTEKEVLKDHKLFMTRKESKSGVEASRPKTLIPGETSRFMGHGYYKENFNDLEAETINEQRKSSSDNEERIEEINTASKSIVRKTTGSRDQTTHQDEVIGEQKQKLQEHPSHDTTISEPGRGNEDINKETVSESVQTNAWILRKDAEQENKVFGGKHIEVDNIKNPVLYKTTRLQINGIEQQEESNSASAESQYGQSKSIMEESSSMSYEQFDTNEVMLHSSPKPVEKFVPESVDLQQLSTNEGILWSEESAETELSSFENLSVFPIERQKTKYSEPLEIKETEAKIIVKTEQQNVTDSGTSDDSFKEITTFTTQNTKKEATEEKKDNTIIVNEEPPENHQEEQQPEFDEWLNLKDNLDKYPFFVTRYQKCGKCLLRELEVEKSLETDAAPNEVLSKENAPVERETTPTIVESHVQPQSVDAGLQLSGIKEVDQQMQTPAKRTEVIELHCYQESPCQLSERNSEKAIQLEQSSSTDKPLSPIFVEEVTFTRQAQKLPPRVPQKPVIINEVALVLPVQKIRKFEPQFNESDTSNTGDYSDSSSLASSYQTAYSSITSVDFGHEQSGHSPARVEESRGAETAETGIQSQNAPSVAGTDAHDSGKSSESTTEERSSQQARPGTQPDAPAGRSQPTVPTGQPTGSSTTPSELNWRALLQQADEFSSISIGQVYPRVHKDELSRKDVSVSEGEQLPVQYSQSSISGEISEGEVQYLKAASALGLV